MTRGQAKTRDISSWVVFSWKPLNYSNQGESFKTFGIYLCAERVEKSTLATTELWQTRGQLTLVRPTHLNYYILGFVSTIGRQAAESAEIAFMSCAINDTGTSNLLCFWRLPTIAQLSARLPDTHCGWEGVFRGDLVVWRNVSYVGKGDADRGTKLPQ